MVLLQGHHFTDCNAAALRLLGARHWEDLVGQPARSYAPERHPDGRRTIDLVLDSIAEALRTGSYRVQAQRQRLTGEIIWVEVLLTPIELGGPTPVVHVVWRDITAARAAQQELQKSKGFTESLLDNIGDDIIAIDREQRITAWNAEAARYFGPEAAAVLSRRLTEALPHLNDQVPQPMAFMRTLTDLPFVTDPRFARP